MTTPAPDHDEAAPVNPRRRRRAVAATAAAVGVAIAAFATVGGDSSIDDGVTEIAQGSSWA